MNGPIGPPRTPRSFPASFAVFPPVHDFPERLAERHEVENQAPDLRVAVCTPPLA